MLMRDEIKAAIEALLFISGERVGRDKLVEVLDLSEADLNQIMREMIVDYNQTQRGIQILAIEDGYIMGSKPEYAHIIKRLIKTPSRRLSPAALETLAIIAYRQPLSRAEIEQVRGVKAERVIATLMERGIIKEVGRKAVPGKPALYGTTHEFLRLFSLSSLNDLPGLDEAE